MIEVALRGGGVTLVDDEDYALATSREWRVMRGRKTGGWLNTLEERT